MALYPSDSLFPSDNLFPDQSPGQQYFLGPETIIYYSLVPDYPQAHLFGTDPMGLIVFRDSHGVWHTTPMMTPDERADADRVYEGGRKYELTDAQAGELAAAGFGAYIITEDPL